MRTQSVESLEQWEQRFATEQHCIEFLEQTRWPDGIICERCRQRHVRKITTRRLPLYECSQCKHQTSLTSGTVFAKSSTPLIKWFIALYYMSRPNGTINALQLQKRIGVTYKTAWLMLHKLRSVISHAEELRPLSGYVAVTLAVHGQQNSSYVNCQSNQHPVWIAATADDPAESEPQPSQIRIVPRNSRDMRTTTAENNAFVMDYLDHEHTEVHFYGKYNLHPRAKTLRLIWKQARTWLVSTYRSIGSRHLALYLHEFCFIYRHSMTASHSSSPLWTAFTALAECCTRRPTS